MLTIPLGISFWQLINQAKVNSSISKILVAETQLNNKLIEIENIRVNWKKQPPSAILKVKASENISSEEVERVEQLLKRELNKKFMVIFNVTASQRVQSLESNQN